LTGSVDLIIRSSEKNV